MIATPQPISWRDHEMCWCVAGCFELLSASFEFREASRKKPLNRKANQNREPRAPHSHSPSLSRCRALVLVIDQLAAKLSLQFGLYARLQNFPTHTKLAQERYKVYPNFEPQSCFVDHVGRRSRRPEPAAAEADHCGAATRCGTATSSSSSVRFGTLRCTKSPSNSK